MIKRLFNQNKKSRKLLGEEFSESLQYDGNPGKGWYRIYSYDLSYPVDKIEMEAVFCPEEELALLLINIGAFREEELPPEGIDRFCEILEFWNKKEKDIILRIVYDSEGKGMEREPALLRLVKEHMVQLGPLIARFSERILTVQGLFVGSWGEMHGSKFLGEKPMKELYKTFLETAGGNCFLSVRKPQQWRLLTGWESMEDEQELPRLGLYNDGMLGSESDFGTYGEAEGRAKSPLEAWNREEELHFQEKICRKVPNGGEVIGEHMFSELPQAIDTLKRMHVTYLNSQYDKKVLDKWKNSSFALRDGITGYDYIGSHLGYRFVVRGAFLPRPSELEPGLRKAAGTYLCIEVENRGFAPLYEKAGVFLILEDEAGKKVEMSLADDPGSWLPGAGQRIYLPLETGDDLPYRLSLCMRRLKDGAVIRFANEPLKDEVYLGLFFYG